MIYTYSTHNDTDILCIYIYMYDWTDRWMYAIQIDTVQPWYSAELWIIVYCCGNCFVCLTSSTSRLSFAEFLGKAEPSGGGSRSQWVLHLTRLTAWHAVKMKKRRRRFDKKRHGRRGLRVARSRTDCGEAAILQNGHGKGFPRWIHWDFRFQSNFLTSNTFYHFLQLFAF